MELTRFEKHMLNVARVESTRSTDPSTKVGAVFTSKHGRVLGAGFNHTARGILFDDARLADREQKLRFTVHAEMHAMRMATHRNLVGSTLFLWFPGVPCVECTKHLIDADIERVICSGGPQHELWADAAKVTGLMLREAGIPLFSIEDVPYE